MSLVKKLNFVTLSPECRNIELVKDVGQIPYVLGKEQNINTAIVASCVDMTGANLQNVSTLKIINVPMILNNTSLTGVVYLLKNAKNIDWLSLHHAGRRSYYWTKLYKFLNPKGKVYLKLDMDFRSCDLYDSDIWERKLFQKNMNIMDLVTVETQAVKERIQPYSSKEIQVLGNGYCKTEFVPDIYQERENNFITVGRLGTEQKATEVLLEAFSLSAEFHEWNLKLVGTIEENFKDTVKEFFDNHPELVERVIFAGEIKEREALYNECCKAKVFVLPSRWEGFAIVGGEALSCGCRVIVSDQVPPMKEFTNSEKYGQIVPSDDVIALKNALIDAAKTETTVEETREIANYANKQFSWSNICKQLYSMLIES